MKFLILSFLCLISATCQKEPYYLSSAAIGLSDTNNNPSGEIVFSFQPDPTYKNQK